MKTFAKYYAIAMLFGFFMFFVFDYLKKQEIFAVLIMGLIVSGLLTLLDFKQKKRE